MKNALKILIFIALAAVLGVLYVWANSTMSEDINTLQHSEVPSDKLLEKKATLEPGRVVELHTNKGVISYILFEKDCPVTTKRIADLVKEGCYDGVNFTRVEEWVIQTDNCKKRVDPMGCELLLGMRHAKGTVGMARGESMNSNTSAFYILLEPAPHLEMRYTAFGRVIEGMDVALSIEKGDTIEKALVRPLTKKDEQLFSRVLQIESERRTQ